MADTRSIIAPVGSANTPAILTGAALAANPARGSWHVQNVGTNPLFINLGGTASSTVYHFVLKGGTGDSDGLGGSVGENSGVVFTGAITFSGTTPKYVILEKTA
jgi:hypothetical protein